MEDFEILMNEASDKIDSLISQITEKNVKIIKQQRELNVLREKINELQLKSKTKDNEKSRKKVSFNV